MEKPAMDEVLISSLFEADPKLDHLPSLEELGGSLRFKFCGDKYSFVLGSLKQLEFFVDAPGIAKEHVSFVMDINGVRIIPILKHQTFVDGVLLNEPMLLANGAIISLADKKFVFKEQSNDVVKMPEKTAASTANKTPAHTPITPSSKPSLSTAKQKPAKISSHLLTAGDSIFLIFFISAAIGAFFIYQKF